MQNEENESANIKAQHPLTPQQDNRVFESIPARPAPWKAPENEMRLPKGKTCADCVFFKRCVGLFQCAPTNTVCDFAPSRFRESWNTPVEPSDSARLAAEEICAYFGDTELAMGGHVNANRVAVIISKHFAATPAPTKPVRPANNDLDLLRQCVEDTIAVARKDEDGDGFITAYHFQTGAIHRLLAEARKGNGQSFD